MILYNFFAGYTIRHGLGKFTRFYNQFCSKKLCESFLKSEHNSFILQIVWWSLLWIQCISCTSYDLCRHADFYVFVFYAIGL
jgi:hypothetical protein